MLQGELPTGHFCEASVTSDLGRSPVPASSIAQGEDGPPCASKPLHHPNGLCVLGPLASVSSPPPPRPCRLLLGLAGSRALPAVSRAPLLCRMPGYTPHTTYNDSTISLQWQAEHLYRCSYWLLCERLSPIDRKQRSRSLSGPFRCSATSPLGVAVHLCYI